VVAVAVCSTKGGSGKTTLAFNLAERAYASGLRVVLVDCDYQEACIGLSMLRDEDCWPVIPGSVSVEGAEQVRSLRDGGSYDLVLCDLPGSEAMALGRMLSVMDLVISPVGVGPTDQMAAANVWMMVSGMGRGDRLVFVPSHFPRGRRRLQGMLDAIRARGAEVCPVALQDRVVHLDTFVEGLGVCESAPGSAAAEEVNRLWEWLAGLLNISLDGLEGSHGG
jgi:chromosome partitioning protein